MAKLKKRTLEQMQTEARFLLKWSKGKLIRHAGSSFYSCGKWSTKLADYGEEQAKANVQALIDAGLAEGNVICFSILKPKA